MSDPSDSANPEAPPGCPRCPSKSTTCLHSASSLGESSPGKARVWMKINGFLKFDYGCCKGCKYLVHECFGEAVFEGDRFEVDDSLANKLADFGIAVKIKDAPVRPMFDDPLSGIHSLTESQRACYAALLTDRLERLPKDLPEEEYNAAAERMAREFAMELAIPGPNPFEPPKPLLRRFGDHPAFERLVTFMLPPELTKEEFEEQKEWEAEREIPASAWPSESGGPVEQFRIVHLGDPSKVEVAPAEAQSPAPAGAAPSDDGISKLVGLGGARAKAQSMYPWQAEAEKTRSKNEQQVKEWMLQQQPERDEIKADPDVQKLEAEAREIESHYRPLLKAMEARWMQLSQDELKDAQVVQNAHTIKMDDLRRRYRNLIEERYGIPNLDDAIDRPSRFSAWLDHRTAGFLWWSGNLVTSVEKGMAIKGMEEAFAKAVEYAKASGLGPPPRPPMEISSRAEAEHYILMLREWAITANRDFSQTQPEQPKSSADVSIASPAQTPSDSGIAAEISEFETAWAGMWKAHSEQRIRESRGQTPTGMMERAEAVNRCQRACARLAQRARERGYDPRPLEIMAIDPTNPPLKEKEMAGGILHLLQAASGGIKPVVEALDGGESAPGIDAMSAGPGWHFMRPPNDRQGRYESADYYFNDTDVEIIGEWIPNFDADQAKFSDLQTVLRTEFGMPFDESRALNVRQIIDCLSRRKDKREQGESAVEQLKSVAGATALDDSAGVGGGTVKQTTLSEAGRRGRLNKHDSDAKRSSLLATIRQHPSLKDDPAKLAGMIGVSESTARRWLNDEEEKYRESVAANPESRE